MSSRSGPDTTVPSTSSASATNARTVRIEIGVALADEPGDAPAVAVLHGPRKFPPQDPLGIAVRGDRSVDPQPEVERISTAQAPLAQEKVPFFDGAIERLAEPLLEPRHALLGLGEDPLPLSFEVIRVVPATGRVHP